MACTSKDQIRQLLAELTAAELDILEHDWTLAARADQLPPDGDWRVWLLMGGRGAGKTRAGAEWVRMLALHELGSGGRIALIGETFGDVRDVMVEGVSGILAVHGNNDRPAWKSSMHMLEWPNGCIAQGFSAEDPESLRGPQFSAAWIDELAKWKHAEETWNMLQFGLRLGENPRQVVTTTPRPVPILKRLIAEDGVVVTRATTAANAANLAPTFLSSIVARYRGTHLGRQELLGELIEDRVDALWTRGLIDKTRVQKVPTLTRIVVAIDPPASSHKRSDACGIVIAGQAATDHAFVLEDASLSAARPLDWARIAVAAFRRHKADRVVAEANQGGEMVMAVLHQIEPHLPVRLVHARRGKWLRAEPVAALYEQGRVHHLRQLPELEDEMCAFGLDGLPGGASPDRLDALVWALSELMLKTSGAPSIRQF